MSPLEAKLERFDREKHALFQLTEPERAAFQLEKFLLYKDRPWEFLKDCVFTLNQVSLNTSSIQPYPCHFDYLKYLTYMWLKHRLIAVPKARRMFCSWNFISLYTHDTIFNSGRYNAFVSKKEDDSAELVSRAEFIYEHIPPWRIPRELLPRVKGGKMRQSPPVLEFEDTYSKIQGFPQGASQLRQFTFSGIFKDELAFWEEAEAAFGASKPTIDGGGRMTGVSSRAPGFFKKIVFDQLNSRDYNFPEIAPAPVKRPMEGVEVWQNPKNQFLIVDLHYTANPEKRSKEWKDGVKAGLPIHTFMTEYEKSWQSYSGLPVYQDFRKGFHSTPSSIDIEAGVPIIFGVDFGLTPAMILMQLVGTQLRIIKEFLETNGSIDKLAPVVMSWLKLNAREHVNMNNIYTAIDPAGVRRSEANSATCKQELIDAGFKRIHPGPVDWESRKRAVENFLLRVNRHGPGLLVSEKDCPMTFEGFNGAYHYPDKAIEIEPLNCVAVKNAHSHPHDGIQYGAAVVSNLSKQTTHRVPTPEYGFQKGAP